MAGTTLIAEIPIDLASMLDKKANEMMLKRTAVLRLALKEYCKDDR